MTIGFGRTGVDEPGTDVLMNVSAKYINNESCDAIWEAEWTKDMIDESMICTINENPYRNACFGDSGGPLYDREANRLVGVVSWGDLECESFPVVYGRVAGVVSSFILENSCWLRSFLTRFPYSNPSLNGSQTLFV